MELDFYQVDAFANECFKGNPAAVVPLTQWLPDEIMQRMAIEHNLSETAFYVPTTNGYHIRWFTPTSEVELCGHATLATAHVLWHHLNYQDDTINFNCLKGHLRVKRDEQRRYVLDFPSDTLEPATDWQDRMEKIVGDRVLECFRGADDYLLIVDSEKTLKSLQPDFRAMASIPDSRGVICTAPGDQVDFVSRGFFPAFGIDEDPVTGSAHTTLMPYWSKRLNKMQLHARQISARGGELECTLDGDRVRIAGHAVTYASGKIWI